MAKLQSEAEGKYGDWTVATWASSIIPGLRSGRFQSIEGALRYYKSTWHLQDQYFPDFLKSVPEFVDAVTRSAQNGCLPWDEYTWFLNETQTERSWCDASVHWQTDDAAKDDSGKNRLDLLPAEALFEVGRVFTFGAEKYGVNNWRKGLRFSRLIAATLRHILKWMIREETDPETGISHLAHAATNLLFLISYQCEKKGTDDRWKMES